MLRFLAAYIQVALDTLLPRKAYVARVDTYSIEDIPVSPLEHAALGKPIVTLLTYTTPAVHDLIRALKYDHSSVAAQLLAEALGEYLREEIATIRAFSALPVVLIPVPLHRSRMRERGFNQIEEILHLLPKEFSDGTLSSIDTQSLERTRATEHQTRLSRAERLRNVSGAFTLKKHLPASHVILIDDVTTTGATLIEAARPLGVMPHTLLALAHA